MLFVIEVVILSVER